MLPIGDKVKWCVLLEPDDMALIVLISLYRQFSLPKRVRSEELLQGSLATA